MAFFQLSGGNINKVEFVDASISKDHATPKSPREILAYKKPLIVNVCVTREGRGKPCFVNGKESSLSFQVDEDGPLLIRVGTRSAVNWEFEIKFI